MPHQPSFAERAADTLIAWHLASTGTTPAVDADALHGGVMTELAIDVSVRLEASPLTVSLRPTEGSLEQQLRTHLAAVLRKAFTDVPGWENKLRDGLDAAARAAVPAPDAEPPPAPPAPSTPSVPPARPAAGSDDRYDNDLDLLREVLPNPGRRRSTVRHTSRRGPGPRRPADDDD